MYHDTHDIASFNPYPSKTQKTWILMTHKNNPKSDNKAPSHALLFNVQNTNVSINFYRQIILLDLQSLANVHNLMKY